MKILLGVPEYPPYHVGGGGEVFKQLAENYRNLGHDVSVLYGYYRTKSSREKIKEYTESLIKFYQIPEIPYPKSMPFLRTVMPPNSNAWFRLGSIMKEEAPDVAHLHGYGFLLINKLAKILHKMNVPYIFTIHGYPETQTQKSLPVRIIYSAFESISVHEALRNSHYITAVSDYIGDDRRLAKYRNKTITILNGINQEEYSIENGNQDLNLYGELGLRKGEDITIFSMGRIARMKGFHLVIKKLARLVKQGLRLHYVVAGNDDGYLGELQGLIKSHRVERHVHFIGWRDKKDIIALTHQCDLFAVPSLWDPCPIAALEGMACNKYIITAGAEGVEEILKDYPYKINIHAQNFDSTLIEMIRNKSYEPIKGIDLSGISWSNVAKKYLHLCDRADEKEVKRGTFER